MRKRLELTKQEQESFKILNYWQKLLDLSNSISIKETGSKNIEFWLNYGLSKMKGHKRVSNEKSEHNAFFYVFYFRSHNSAENQYFLTRFLLLTCYYLGLIVFINSLRFLNSPALALLTQAVSSFLLKIRTLFTLKNATLTFESSNFLYKRDEKFSLGTNVFLV